MTFAGQKLYWDYYCYVKSNPVDIWNVPTSILYGSKDNVCEYGVISKFTESFDCNLTVMEDGEHYFHTKEQLEFLDEWLEKSILAE